MGTTTKMAIPYPEATGLVKDGWEDMKDIATQVDAKSGLVLLTSGTFTGSTSQSYTSFYSTNYDAYKILINVYASVSTAELRFRFRNSSGDITANYYGAGYYSTYANTSGINYPKNNASEAVLLALSNNSGHESMISMDLGSYSSQKSKQLTGTASGTLDGLSRAFAYYEVGTGTDMTGFTIYPSSGTITGGIKIYGYNK